MPIYEYLCEDCNRIYSFLVRGATADEGPNCPRCGAESLKKQVSRFAFSRKSSPHRSGPLHADGMDGPNPNPLDDPRTEREMQKLMRDADSVDESDPRQLAALMRRMGQVTGEPFDEGMEEAVRRLEAGEDPDRIEEDLGDAIDDGFGGSGSSGPSAPSRDDGLYSF